MYLGLALSAIAAGGGWILTEFLLRSFSPIQMHAASPYVPPLEEKIQPSRFGFQSQFQFLLLAAVFCLGYLAFDFSPRLLLVWAFIVALLAITRIDSQRMVIPNAIVLPGAAIGLTASISLSPPSWGEYLLSAFGAAFLLLLPSIMLPGSLGMGDVKMSLFMGAVLGKTVLIALFLAFLMGGMAGLALILLGRKGRKDKIPFGPYLAVSSLIALFVGDLLIDSYMALT